MKSLITLDIYDLPAQLKYDELREVVKSGKSLYAVKFSDTCTYRVYLRDSRVFAFIKACQVDWRGDEAGKRIAGWDLTSLLHSNEYQFLNVAAALGLVIYSALEKNVESNFWEESDRWLTESMDREISNAIPDNSILHADTWEWHGHEGAGGGTYAFAVKEISIDTDSPRYTWFEINGDIDDFCDDNCDGRAEIYATTGLTEPEIVKRRTISLGNHCKSQLYSFTQVMRDAANDSCIRKAGVNAVEESFADLDWITVQSMEPALTQALYKAICRELSNLCPNLASITIGMALEYDDTGEYFSCIQDIEFVGLEGQSAAISYWSEGFSALDELYPEDTVRMDGEYGGEAYDELVAVIGADIDSKFSVIEALAEYCAATTRSGDRTFHIRTAGKNEQGVA